MSRRPGRLSLPQSLALYAAVIVLSCHMPAGAADEKAEGSQSQESEVQGRWEREEPEGSDASYKRATKEIKGNTETVTYFDADGKVVRQHKVNFKVSRQGDVHIFTYTDWEATEGPQKGTKMPGPVSYIYRVSDKQFREAWGFLPGQENRRSLLLVWKKADEERKQAALAAATEKGASVAAITPDALKGTWQPLSSERGGKPQAAEEFEPIRLTFEGDRFTVKRDDELLVRGTYKVDASSKPAQIDMTIEESPRNPDDVGRVARGILEWSEEQLKWCTGGVRTEERPTEFRTQEGSRTMLVVMKRVQQ